MRFHAFPFIFSLFCWSSVASRALKRGVNLAFLSFEENKHVIFTGNGYSAEWPVEANKRGLPNLNTTPTLDRFHMI